MLVTHHDAAASAAARTVRLTAGKIAADTAVMI
jgi:hypothetical protein